MHNKDNFQQQRWQKKKCFIWIQLVTPFALSGRVLALNPNRWCKFDEPNSVVTLQHCGKILFLENVSLICL